MYLILLLFALDVSRAIFVSPNLPLYNEPFKRIAVDVDSDDAASYHEEPAAGRPYREPGDWATPSPDSGIDVGFTPIQTYVAVRRSSSSQRLPQSEAYKESTSPDELRNAHRLREVLRTKKIQEVYSEEGYEDSAFDHGTRERVAEYAENYEKERKGNVRGTKKFVDVDDSSDSESRLKEKINKVKREPKTSRKQVETKKVAFSYVEPEDNLRIKKSNYLVDVKEGGLSPRAYREYSANGDFVDHPHITFEDWKPRVNKFNEVFNKGRVGKFNEETVEDTPAFKYIHSLTDAHYGHQPPLPVRQPKAIPPQLISMTNGLAATSEFTSFEPKKVSKRVKRGTENNESSHYERELAKALDEHERVIISKVLENVAFPFKADDDMVSYEPPPKPKSAWVDTNKYPFYYLQNIDPYSALKYASHPNKFPSKSGSGMEYYDSRDRMIQCDDISINLEDVADNSTQSGKKKRISGLGDKIRCMKIKYFGEDPLDNPFFNEDALNTHPSTASPFTDMKPAGSTPVQGKIISANDSSSVGTQPEVNYEVFHPVTVRPTENKAAKKIIPVKEFYPEITTSSPIRGLLPPAAYPLHPFSVLTIPRLSKPKPLKQMKKVKSMYNCLQPVTKMIVTERSDEDVMFDCPDVTLIQTVRGDNQHFKIYPKQLQVSRSQSDDERRLLHAGEVFETRYRLTRRKRSEDLNARRRSQLFPNRMLLDKMMRKSPLLRRQNSTNDITSSSTTTLKPNVVTSVKTPVIPKTGRNRPPATTPRTTTTTEPQEIVSPANKKIMPKKPSGKISGLDFLTRYHKAKNPANRNGMHSVEFFKAVESDSVRSQSKSKRWAVESESSEPVLTGTSYLRRSDVMENRMRRSWDSPPKKAPVLLYVVNVDTGVGKWISQPTIIPEVRWKSHRYLPILQPKTE